MPLGVCDASSALLFSRDSDTPARTVSYRLRPRSRPEDCSSVLVGKSPRSFSRLLRRLSFLTSTLLTKDDLSVNFKFNVPELRVGAFDDLIELGDTISEVVSPLLDAVARRIQKQFVELHSSDGMDEELTVDGIPPDQFLTSFEWDGAKNPTHRPIKKIVQELRENVATIDEELKVKTSEYAAAKAQLSGISRKTGGSLATRDLGDIVQESDIIETDNLVTLFVAVPIFSKKDWLKSYETLAHFVVPRSSKLIKEDEEYALYTVTLFHRVVDAFKSAAHEKSFQVREFHYNAETIQSEASERNDRVREVEERSAALDSLCRACYRNVISDWIHVCAIRIFVESVLRYGLPPNFLACIIKPHKKSEIKLRRILRDWLGHGALLNWDILPEDEKRNMKRSYPYVSFALIL